MASRASEGEVLPVGSGSLVGIVRSIHITGDECGPMLQERRVALSVLTADWVVGALSKESIFQQESKVCCSRMS